MNITNTSQWMDLRIDYAFKIFFTSDNGIRLVSLLNAIFANKAIPRKIISLTITNPNLEKHSPEDKYSILDIRANLDDNTFVLIEMHLYGLTIFKHKTLRSWARVYGESLTKGEDYNQQHPGICISFIDGPITDAEGNLIKKTPRPISYNRARQPSDTPTRFRNALYRHTGLYSGFYKSHPKQHHHHRQHVYKLANPNNPRKQPQ